MINKKFIITGALALTLLAGSSTLLKGDSTVSASVVSDYTPEIEQNGKTNNKNYTSDIYENKSKEDIKELGKKAQEEELRKQGITKKINELTDEEKKQIITNMINEAEEEIKKEYDVKDIKKEYNYLEVELKDGSMVSTSINEEQFFQNFDK